MSDGLTRGERNNNPGNIVATSIKWRGEVPSSDARFEQFATPEDGIRAIAKLMITYHREGRCSVRTMINAYAPPVENDTGAYVKAVADDCAVDPDARLLLVDDTLQKLVTAIIRHENGRVRYSDQTIAACVAAAHT